MKGSAVLVLCWPVFFISAIQDYGHYCSTFSAIPRSLPNFNSRRGALLLAQADYLVLVITSNTNRTEYLIRTGPRFSYFQANRATKKGAQPHHRAGIMESCFEAT
ncbi:hypothetical protein L208DRAFT_417152 [Tricholoma matsutake]|nr:hypothetical protein L208DRAFT_417152 [Tricholoma matsutake 945]